jgi:succinate dehydrogenase/fumarate reductase flavoprotein subunit
MVEAPDRSLGGLWVGFDDDERNPCNHATSLPGLWAVGGAIGLYFGRNPGSGTPLLAALFGAERAAAAMLRAEPASGEYDSLLDEARERAVRRAEELLGSDADPTPYALRDELVRSWQGFAERLAGARTGDESPIANASLRLLLELHAITPLLAGWGGSA